MEFIERHKSFGRIYPHTNFTNMFIWGVIRYIIVSKLNYLLIRQLVKYGVGVQFPRLIVGVIEGEI